MTKPTPEMIKDLRKRNHLTQRQLADSLYGVKYDRIPDYECGRRNCPAVIWWAMVLTHDGIDLWNEEHQ